MELFYALLLIFGFIAILLIFSILIKILYWIFFFLPMKRINYFIIRYIKRYSTQKKLENIWKEAAEIQILHFFKNSQFTMWFLLAITYSFLITSALELFLFHEWFIIFFSFIFISFFLIFYNWRQKYNFSDYSDIWDIIIEWFSDINIWDLLPNIDI